MLEIFNPKSRSLIVKHLEQNGFGGRFAAAQLGFFDNEDETHTASDLTVWHLLIETPEYQKIFDER